MILGNPKELGHRTEHRDNDREAEAGQFPEGLMWEVSASERWQEWDATLKLQVEECHKVAFILEKEFC